MSLTLFNLLSATAQHHDRTQIHTSCDYLLLLLSAAVSHSSYPTVLLQCEGKAASPLQSQLLTQILIPLSRKHFMN